MVAQFLQQQESPAEGPKSFLGMVGLNDGEDMLRELKEKRTGMKLARTQADPEKETEDEPAARDKTEPAKPTPARESDIDFLKRTVSGYETRTRELEAKIASQNGALQAYMSQAPRTEQRTAPKQPELTPLQIGDPDLQAAFNAVDARNEQRFKIYIDNTERQRHQQTYAQELKTVNSALAEARAACPEWAAAVPDSKVNEFIQGYVNNPENHGRIDWKNEFKLAVDTFRHPQVIRENEELKAKLAKYEKGNDKARQQQKENLSKVPQTGARSGGTSSGAGVAVGDQILNEWRSKNGRKKMPDGLFGQELFRRVTGGI